MGSIAFNFWWKWALARTPGELLFSGQKGRATKRAKHTEEEEEQTNRKEKKKTKNKEGCDRNCGRLFDGTKSGHRRFRGLIRSTRARALVK